MGKIENKQPKYLEGKGYRDLGWLNDRFWVLVRAGWD